MHCRILLQYGTAQWGCESASDNQIFSLEYQEYYSQTYLITVFGTSRADMEYEKLFKQEKFHQNKVDKAAARHGAQSGKNKINQTEQETPGSEILEQATQTRSKKSEKYVGWEWKKGNH